MTEGELIDKLVSDLYNLAADRKTGVKYGLARFAVPWGNKGTEQYRATAVAFGNAIVDFAKDCGIKYYSNSFWYFNGKVYETIKESAVSMAYDMLMMKMGIATMMTNDQFKKKYFINIIRGYNPLRVRNDVVAFSNRIVDLRKGDNEKYQHSWNPKWHIIDYHPYPYDPKATAPLFHRFLNEVLPDKRQRDILQMFLGLGLVQSQDAFDKKYSGPRGTTEICLILLGSGANGKSVLFNIIVALFGKQHVTSVDYDTMTSDGDEGLRGRATIRSAVFNWSSDSDPRRFGKKNNAVFKQICSGEPYQYRLLGKDIMTAERCPYLIFSFNELPKLSEATGGFMRRLQFVNFDVTIPKYRQDPTLAQRIIDNDLPGVFNWVMRGAKEIRRRKFQFPSSDVSLKNKVKALMPTNPVFAWKLTYSLRGDVVNPLEAAELISAETLYLCFTKFCDNNNFDSSVISMQKFGRILATLGFEKIRTGKGVVYKCYGANENQLRTPMMIDMLKETGGDAFSSNDAESYIKED